MFLQFLLEFEQIYDLPFPTVTIVDEVGECYESSSLNYGTLPFWKSGDMAEL